MDARDSGMDMSIETLLALHGLKGREIDFSESSHRRPFSEFSMGSLVTKPRHAFTHGFVERLQQTILHEHWRIEFRRRYFTRLRQLEASLQSYLRFYNHACRLGQMAWRRDLE